MRTIWLWMRAAGVLLGYAVLFLLGFYLFDSKTYKWTLGVFYGVLFTAFLVALFVKHT
jgi:hypothetical protein